MPYFFGTRNTPTDVLRDFRVFTLGYVPLKSYFPDGDIDLSLFSKHQNLNDTWAKEICNVLESEEKSEYAEFHVKEVHYIKAEVYSLLSLSFWEIEHLTVFYSMMLSNFQFIN